MAAIAEITGAGRSDVIPDHTLSPLTLLDYGELERAFEARHIARASAAATGLTPEAAGQVAGIAIADVRRGLFSLGSPDFNVEAMKVQNLPLLTWLELRRTHPGTTQERAGQLLRECVDVKAAQDAILTLAGFVEKKRKAPAAGDSAPTGEPSSDKSESPQGSATQTSAT